MVSAMPTDKERREVAAKLRDIAVRTNPSWPALMEALGTPGRAVTVMRLADLIEPEERTCYIEHIDEDSFHLSCGHEAAGHVSPSFCPYCGAKVVE